MLCSVLCLLFNPYWFNVVDRSVSILLYIFFFAIALLIFVAHAVGPCKKYQFICFVKLFFTFLFWDSQLILYKLFDLFDHSTLMTCYL